MIMSVAAFLWWQTNFTLFSLRMILIILKTMKFFVETLTGLQTKSIRLQVKYWILKPCVAAAGGGAVM